jgi:general secretion pathway protein G
MSANREDTLARQRGFTLLEIMVVVAIIAILSTVVLMNITGNVEDAQQARAKQDVATLVSALQLYKLDNFNYPSTQQGLDALRSKPSGTPATPNWKQYVSQLPADPWGKPYQYLNPGQHGDFDVFSYGSDGKPGGEGESADIGNW